MARAVRSTQCGPPESDPDLFKPGSERGGGLSEAQCWRGFEGFEDTLRGCAAVVAKQGRALGEKFWDRAGEELWIVGAGENVEVAEREAAPWGAKDAEPGDAVERIEDGAGKSECVENFGTRGELFEVDGAEGDRRLRGVPARWGRGRCGCGRGRRCDTSFPCLASSRARRHRSMRRCGCG